MDQDIFVYEVDHNDVIVMVSQNWESFANCNTWTANIGPKDVLGRPLWDFIQNMEARHLYKGLFQKVRTGVSSGPIPFRCDSPEERRFLTLELSPLPNGHIKIKSTIERVESRDPVSMIDIKAPRSDELVTICSMCKKIALPTKTWVEIEDGLVQMRLFEADEMPKLTHGLCPDCHQVLKTEIEGVPLSDMAN